MKGPALRAIKPLHVERRDCVSDQPIILLVDDSQGDIALFQIASKRSDFRNSLQVVHNGEEAISYLRGDGAYADRDQYPVPALMLLDLNMPKKNGFEVLRWVRLQPGLKRLPIVILTGSPRVEDVNESYDLGANAFLVKPGGLEGLTAMVLFLRDWLQLCRLPSLPELANL